MWQFQAMLQMIPAVVIYWFTVTLFFGGILAYLISKFIKFVPFVSKYKFPIEIASVLAVILGGYLYGGAEYRLKAQEMAEKVKAAEELSRTANKTMQRELDEKTKKIQDQEKRLRDQVKQSTQRIDAQCRVDSEAVRIINEAAKGPKKK